VVQDEKLAIDFIIFKLYEKYITEMNYKRCRCQVCSQMMYPLLIKHTIMNLDSLPAKHKLVYSNLEPSSIFLRTKTTLQKQIETSIRNSPHLKKSLTILTKKLADTETKETGRMVVEKQPPRLPLVNDIIQKFVLHQFDNPFREQR
jgi:hypothetical protein